MIFDRLENIQKYQGLFPHLDTAIAWLGNHSIDELPMGKTEIDGNNVFVNVMQAQTRPLQGAEFEVHHKYMDLQINLEAGESFAVGDTTCTPNPETDVGFCSGEVQCKGNLLKGWFVLFLAEEPHLPTLNLTENSHSVKKAVFKISAEK